MRNLSDLRIKLFADGADKAQILKWHDKPFIRGFTTNPTLMRAAGVNDYEGFAREVLDIVKDRPVSFEVLADEFCDMERQAHEIAKWGENVFVKIPVTNTRRQPSMELIHVLARSGVKVNVTAVLTLEQVRAAAEAMAGGPPCLLSIFAGRIADTGRDPIPVIAAAAEVVAKHRNIELIWASPRELLNIFQANDAGCHIITVTDNILEKLQTIGKDLNDYSLETVLMFYKDAAKAGYQL
jgi:transaldolase